MICSPKSQNLGIFQAMFDDTEECYKFWSCSLTMRGRILKKYYFFHNRGFLSVICEVMYHHFKLNVLSLVGHPGCLQQDFLGCDWNRSTHGWVAHQTTKETAFYTRDKIPSGNQTWLAVACYGLLENPPFGSIIFPASHCYINKLSFFTRLLQPGILPEGKFHVALVCQVFCHP